MAKEQVYPAVQEAPRIRRFVTSQLLEHLVLMISFTVLVVTGLPQKFPLAPGASTIILWLGGIETTRFIHRTFAVIFVLEAFYHLVFVLLATFKWKARPAIVPTLQDALDVITTLRYSLGLTDRQARFDRFDYRQKFEYWGIVFGGTIMILSGAILWFPTWISRFLPGEIVPAAKEAHGGEALLAMLIIVTWHLYSAHLNPQRFPGDTTMFTGKIPAKRMAEEHPLEYERLMQAQGIQSDPQGDTDHPQDEG
ncbi:MAG: cytochrome C [Chloroflexi bacterium]|nr:cytochrome C [Chloroflexota bacterium]